MTLEPRPIASRDGYGYGHEKRAIATHSVVAQGAAKRDEHGDDALERFLATLRPVRRRRRRNARSARRAKVDLGESQLAHLEGETGESLAAAE